MGINGNGKNTIKNEVLKKVKASTDNDICIRMLILALFIKTNETEVNAHQ